ncbi:MAG: DUF945 family protein [Pseudomonadota bacterium]
MKNYLTAAVVLLLVLVAAPWGIGMVAEQRVNSGLDQLVKIAPYLSIVDRKWQRGWFTSEQEVTFEVFGPWLRASNSGKQETPADTPVDEVAAAGSPVVAAGETPPAESPPADSAVQPAAAVISPVKFTVRNHIVHGPVLWLSGLGIARVDSHVVVPETIRAELVKLFGEESPVAVSTRVRFFGGGTTTISGDARDFEMPGKGQAVSYDAFKLKLGYSAHLDDVEVDGGWPRLEFSDREKGGSVLLEDAVVSGVSHRVRGDLYDGDFDLSVAKVRMVGLNKQVTEVAGLHYVVDTTIDDDFMDVALKIGSGAVKAKELEELGVSLKEVHYDFTVRRLHVETLVKLLSEMKASYSRPVPTAAAVEAAMMQPMREAGLELLKHDPEWVIDRVGVATPEGDAYIKGIIKLKGVTGQDFSAGAMGMLGKIEADITIEVAQKLVEKMPNGLSSVATVIDQGYAKRERDQIVSHLEYNKGVLKINGKEQGIPGLGPPKVGFESEPTPPQPE